jgi:hypothetical protein
MDEDTCIVIMIVGVPADVRPAVDQQDLLARAAREPLGKNASGVAGPYNQVIEEDYLAIAIVL